MHRRSRQDSVVGKRATPFVKWAGGKSQLLDQFEPLFPSHIGRYHEPFVGGGAVLFHLASSDRISGTAFLCDLNNELMNAYRVVRSRPRALIQDLRERSRQYHGGDAKRYFYWVRDEEIPISAVQRAARFVFLNKTCYNGLFRVNRNGRFNVPLGRYKNPQICDEGTILAASRVLAGAKLLRPAPFEKSLTKVASGDFVYVDPPYQPISPTANFTGYTAVGFGFEDQGRLAREVARLHRLGARVMLSNSDHDAVERLYSRPEYNITEVFAKRAINSDACGRGAIPELVVRNYQA